VERVDGDVRSMLAYQAGDEAAFDALFARFSGPLLGYLRRMVGEAAIAEELLQETFLRVARARERYTPDARFSTWIYTIATRLALNELRRSFRRAPHESTSDSGDADDGPGLQLAAGQPGVDDEAHLRRASSEVEEALAGLPERQRAALWLAAVEGRSYAEVADVLETTESSVKSLVHRARAALAKRVSPELQQEFGT